MADFCKRCSIEIFGEDFGDLAGLCGTGETVTTICEGCGPGIFDHLGELVKDVEHNEIQS